ncbi:MAG TPA: hypothetical protein IGR15_02575 [Synechococcus sp. M44_DOE_062]|nr:hypothetical protein [Synechococcus sp. M44_DOE_062]
MPKLILLKATVQRTWGTSGDSGSATTIPTNYFFLGTDGVYKGDIATITGIREASDEEKLKFPPTKIGLLVRKGILERFIATGRTTQSNVIRVRRFILYAAQGKGASVMSDIIGKSIRGVEIQSVVVPTRMKKYY